MEIIIKNLSFSQDQYFNKIYEKNQIVIHHTVSPSSKYTTSDGILGDVNYWGSNAERVATCSIIGSDGCAYKLFDSNLWAHHLGITTATFNKFGLPNINEELNKHSIGIELDSFGPLYYDSKSKVFKPAAPYLKNSGYTIKEENVIHYPNKYRGFEFYEKYTEEQINTLKILLQDWCKKYDIPLKYNSDMWDISQDALTGVDGIWTHSSYRFDKQDCHPDPSLIKMLKSLTLNEPAEVINNIDPEIYTPTKPTVFTTSYSNRQAFNAKMKELLNLNNIKDYEISVRRSHK